MSFALYGVIPSPVDDSVWGVSESYPGYLVRMQRGNNPPESCKTQIFKVPEPGFDPRGVDIDSNGVVWTALAASSHLASFDVRKCKDLNGPAKPDGSQCKEGWSLYQTTGPKLKGTDIPADFHYYNWVDQFNTLGLGENIPINNGTTSDSLIALMPDTGKSVVLRVPYPIGFHTRGLDGRIDESRIRTVNGAGGTGALMILMHVLGRARPKGRIFISDPTWRGTAWRARGLVSPITGRRPCSRRDRKSMFASNATAGR